MICKEMFRRFRNRQVERFSFYRDSGGELHGTETVGSTDLQLFTGPRYLLYKNGKLMHYATPCTNRSSRKNQTVQFLKIGKRIKTL